MKPPGHYARVYLSLLGPPGHLPPASLVALHPAAQLISKPAEAQEGTALCRSKAPTFLARNRREHSRESWCSRTQGQNEWQGRCPSSGSPAPQGLSSVEVPAIRGEEEVVQVSQQQLLGVPGEGCQVPGARQGEAVIAAAQHATNREAHDGKEQLWLPSKRKDILGGEGMQHP